MARCKRDDLSAPRREKSVSADRKRARTLLDCRGEGRLDLAAVACLEHEQTWHLVARVASSSPGFISMSEGTVEFD